MNTKDSTYISPSLSAHFRPLIHTPSLFAKTNLLYLQEIGKQQVQQFRRASAPAPYAGTGKGIPSYLCLLVLRGGGHIRYDGTEYILKQGDVAFLDCRKPCSYVGDDRTVAESSGLLQWCHYYGHHADALYKMYEEQGGQPVFHPNDLSVYQELLDKLYETAKADALVCDVKINELLSSLLAHLMQDARNPGSRRRQGTKRANIEQIKSYLDENYGERISLESAAETFSLNKSYLARLFKAQYGMTLTAYIQEVRVTRAKELLRFTERSVEEIGAECGLGELTYFSRVFKKVEGISPREYRKRWKGI